MPFPTIAERLKELAILRASGEITEEEYVHFKDGLLRGTLIQNESTPVRVKSDELPIRQLDTSSLSPSIDDTRIQQSAVEGLERETSGRATAVTASGGTNPSWTCPYCASGMSADRRHGVCPNCGWHNGVVPLNTICDSSGDSATVFGAEPRLPHARSSLFWLTAAGLITIAAASSGGSEGIGFVLVGIVELVMAFTVAWITRFGREYYRLSPPMRGFVRATLGIGRVFTWASLIGVIIGLFGGDWIRNNA